MSTKDVPYSYYRDNAMAGVQCRKPGYLYGELCSVLDVCNAVLAEIDAKKRGDSEVTDEETPEYLNDAELLVEQAGIKVLDAIQALGTLKDRQRAYKAVRELEVRRDAILSKHRQIILAEKEQRESELAGKEDPK